METSVRAEWKIVRRHLVAAIYFRIKNVRLTPSAILTATVVAYVAFCIFKSCSVWLWGEQRASPFLPRSISYSSSQRVKQEKIAQEARRRARIEEAKTAAALTRLSSFSFKKALQEVEGRRAIQAAETGFALVETEETSLKMQVADSLFEGIVAHNKLQDLLDLLFKKNIKNQLILELLEMLEIKYPDFVMSKSIIDQIQAKGDKELNFRLENFLNSQQKKILKKEVELLSQQNVVYEG